MYIETEEALREIYGFPKGRAKAKQLTALEKHSAQFIEHSPFVTLSSYDASGSVDCSPRGGKPGFVKIVNPNCILIPDANGNKRLDSLVNIIQTSNVGALFLIPGVDETLRINGTARISTAREHLDLFSAQQNPPKTCIAITIEQVFLHCAKALMRSELWSPDSLIERASLPTMGVMLGDQLSQELEPETQEEMVERYRPDL